MAWVVTLRITTTTGCRTSSILDMVSGHVRSKMNMSCHEHRGVLEVGTIRLPFPAARSTRCNLNNGKRHFQRGGQLAGISKTDCWAPLLADLDNDGWNDLLATNGFKRDTRTTTTPLPRTR